MAKISAARAKKLVSKGGKIFDVRSPIEFARINIPGSVNLPLRNISHMVTHAKKTTNIILIGDKNITKDLEMAEKYAIQLGFINIFTISDIDQWDTPTYK